MGGTNKHQHTFIMPSAVHHQYAEASNSNARIAKHVQLCLSLVGNFLVSRAPSFDQAAVNGLMGWTCQALDFLQKVLHI